MTLSSHLRSINHKDYRKKQAVRNAIYNSNYREKVKTDHPLDTVTINQVFNYQLEYCPKKAQLCTKENNKEEMLNAPFVGST